MRVRAALVLMLAVASSGCMFKKKPAPQPPAAVVPAPAPAPVPVPDPVTPPKPVAPKPVVVRPAKPPAPAPTPAPAPQLGEILTPAQQSEMNRTVDQSTTAARASLIRLRAKKLTSAQADIATRIKTFADQADQARRTDLRAAVQLARRAEVLARDLESSIK